MTDATTGPGAEGAPRDGRNRGRSAVPATPPGHDPAVDPPTAARRESVPETGRTGAETRRTGTETDRTGVDRTGMDTGTPGRGGREVPGNLGGAPAEGPGRDSTPDRAGTPGSHGPSGTSGDAAPLVTGSEQSHGSEENRGAHGTRLLPHEESDKLSARLQHAVADFVDGPKHAVEEADHVLEEAAARFTEAVTQRRRTLRRSWQAAEAGDGKPASSSDTEQLRLALRDYRELTDRLLRL
ncbi:hypothetical protein [Streptomyces sp. YU58]|uniref:hypothetical protein n=1 Tax=Streptomyces sp. SX92 TaxID=3158972 RepID=UPI0027BA73B7|nr:hypothetical protein [Streptomyces coralus]WLW55459.1 hypothetical protein QU709_30790 [Streptomyces coralus]